MIKKAKKKQTKIEVVEKRQNKILEKFGFVQMVFDFYSASPG